MDGVYALPQPLRAHFLRSLLQSFGCTYVCLWQHASNLSKYISFSHTLYSDLFAYVLVYFSLYSRLFFFDGFYNVPNNQPSSSLGTEAQSLFHQYTTLTFDVSHE